MALLRTKKRLVTSFAVIVLLCGAAFYALAQQTGEAKKAPAPQAGPKRHKLAATLETVQWGWLDPKEPPKLTVDSGDIVSVETMMHSHGKVRPGITMDEIVALRKANPGGGPHSVTGPIYVNGAEPGDVMEIRILKIVPKPFGINFNLPGKDFPTIGALALEMPDGFVKFFTLDLAKRQAEFKPGIILDLRPFPGTLAVGIDPNDPAPRKGGTTDPMAPVSTLRPWKNGSNMDINELQEGTTIFIPVFLKGGLVWTGDSHCRQGNGEVNLTALECSYREIAMQLIARKDMKLEWPRMETKTHWIMMGFDEDLNKALVEAVGGDRGRVESLAPAVHDPHAVDVKPGQLAKLKTAALLVRIGLDHEPWLARVRRAGGDPRFTPGGPDDLDVSKGVELLQTETARVRSERGVHVHGFGNPHYWLDPANARPITRAILEALARLAPADRDAFAANRTRFLARLDDALARWTEALAPYRGTRAVVVHDSWPYFARRFGLVVVAAVEPAPGVPPSAASLAALTAKMRQARVRLVIGEPSSNASLVSHVAARGGARAVVLVPSVGADPEAGDYVALFELDVRRLVEALDP